MSINTIPFSFEQDPDEILRIYNNNLPAIAAAAHKGFVNPTVAVLAGLRKEYLQTAMQGAGTKPQTVAQEVFAPSAPMMGLGGLPQGGAPAMPQAPMAPPMAAPQETAMMAEGGLAGLEIPDDMFMESDNYAGGGMVAFAYGGGINKKPNYLGMTDEDIIASMPEFKALPIDEAMTAYREQVGEPRGEFSKRYKENLERRMTPEYGKKQVDEDVAAFLTRFGFGAAAGKSANALENFAAAAAPAGEEAIKAQKERKKEERETLKEAVNMELEEYGIKVKSFEGAMQYKKTVDDLTAKGIDLETAKAKAVLDLREGKRNREVQWAQVNRLTGPERMVNDLAADYLRKNPGASPVEARAAAVREYSTFSPYGDLGGATKLLDYKKKLLETWPKKSEYDRLALLRDRLTGNNLARFNALEQERQGLLAQAEALAAAEDTSADVMPQVDLANWGKPKVINP